MTLMTVTANEPTLLELAVSRGGIFKGARAATVIASWAIAVRRLGHELGEDEGGHQTAAIREYSAHWRHGERTGWNDLRRFREVFPEEQSPARLAAIVNETADVLTMSRDELVAGLRLAV